MTEVTTAAAAGPPAAAAMALVAAIAPAELVAMDVVHAVQGEAGSQVCQIPDLVNPFALDLGLLNLLGLLS